MIKLNKIKVQTVQVYNPQGELMGKANLFELQDLLIQIKEAKAEGYYVMFNGEKIEILSRGNIAKRPHGFFTLMGEQLRKLI